MPRPQTCLIGRQTQVNIKQVNVKLLQILSAEAAEPRLCLQQWDKPAQGHAENSLIIMQRLTVQPVGLHRQAAGRAGSHLNTAHIHKKLKYLGQKSPKIRAENYKFTRNTYHELIRFFIKAWLFLNSNIKIIKKGKNSNIDKKRYFKKNVK